MYTTSPKKTLKLDKVALARQGTPNGRSSVLEKSYTPQLMGGSPTNEQLRTFDSDNRRNSVGAVRMQYQ